ASCVAVVLGMIVGAAGFELLGAEAPAVPEPGWWGLAVPAPLVPAPPPCDPGPAAAPASAFFGWGPAAAGFPACCGPRCHSGEPANISSRATRWAPTVTGFPSAERTETGVLVGPVVWT